MKGSSPRIALYLLVVFLSGVAVGGFGHRLYSVKAVSAKEPSHRRGPDDWRKQFTNDMQSRLALSPEQSRQLNTILDETRAEYAAAKDRMKPEMTRIHDSQVEKIKSILDPAQQAGYEKIHDERERRYRHKKP